MSKYYINQKFSLKDRFTIKDENQIDVFAAEGEFFSIGKKITLRTLSGEDLLLIKEKVLSLLSRFEFYIGDQLICEMKQEFAFFQKKYNIVMPDWQIEGDIWDFNFDIRENGRPIATIRKKWLSWMDAYEVDILEEEYTELILGIVIAIDADLEDDG
ncbi:MAG TPA: LURP-one-related family protein [Atopostipes sp.]|nr:LURP-one-related family protein [Atopostipes sp.]